MLRQALSFRGAVIALLLGLLGTGLAFLVLRAGGSGGDIEIILPSATPPPSAVVYVSGAVAREGVYTLKEGDRVADAVEAAGGLAPDADRAGVNLAARIADEQHIHVPRQSEGTAGTAARIAPGGPVNINTASQVELERLPGVGPVLARAIIEYRQANGAFTRVEDLLKVPRIGEATLARLRPLIAVR